MAQPTVWHRLRLASADLLAKRAVEATFAAIATVAGLSRAWLDDPVTDLASVAVATVAIIAGLLWAFWDSPDTRLIVRLAVAALSSVTLVSAAVVFDQRSIPLPDFPVHGALTEAMQRGDVDLYARELNTVQRSGDPRVSVESALIRYPRAHIFLPFRWRKREAVGLQRTYEGTVYARARLVCLKNALRLADPELVRVRVGPAAGVLSFFAAPLEAPFLFRSSVVSRVFWPTLHAVAVEPSNGAGCML